MQRDAGQPRDKKQGRQAKKKESGLLFAKELKEHSSDSKLCRV